MRPNFLGGVCVLLGENIHTFQTQMLAWVFARWHCWSGWKMHNTQFVRGDQPNSTTVLLWSDTSPENKALPVMPDAVQKLGRKAEPSLIAGPTARGTNPKCGIPCKPTIFLSFLGQSSDMPTQWAAGSLQINIFLLKKTFQWLRRTFPEDSPFTASSLRNYLATGCNLIKVFT